MPKALFLAKEGHFFCPTLKMFSNHKSHPEMREGGEGKGLTLLAHSFAMSPGLGIALRTRRFF